MSPISYYFAEFSNSISDKEDLYALIDMHEQTFRDYSWEPVRLDERDAKKHPLYALFDDPNTVLGTSINPWEYTRACYMRWLAYAVAGHPFADFDVINYGFTPDDAADVRLRNAANKPIFLSQAGAIGLFDKGHYDQLLDTYVGFIREPSYEGVLAEEINDMTIMRQLRPDWYDCIPYDDDRFSKDYTRQGWEAAKLVHYLYDRTPQPRVKTILAQRNPYGDYCAKKRE